MCFRKKLSPLYFVKNISTVIGFVLVWRGIWYALDWFDMRFLDGTHIWSTLGGIVIGLLLIYWPDRDLRKIENL